MRTSARLAVVPLAAVLLLAGCGRPGTAATVDGHRITDASLATLVDELSRLTTSATTAQSVLPDMIIAPTVDRVAAEYGAAVTDQQAIQVLDNSAAQLQVEPWDYSPEMIAYGRQFLETQVLKDDPEAAAEIGQGIKDLDVEVNPRFGTWDAGILAPTQWPWLIAPAAG